VIVATRPPRRKRTKAARKGRAGRVKELEPDPEADARVEAFFARMIQPR
jgi:hypothetical protein